MISILFLASTVAHATPDWSQGALVPSEGRKNILELSPSDFSAYQQAGLIHAQFYPVEVTGLLPPYEPLRHTLEDRSGNPLKRFLEKFARRIAGFNSFDSVLKSLGLHPYPKANDEGVYQVPYPNGGRPDHRMGFSLIERNGAQGFTLSCAACHSANLFGKTVLGMTNRFPRANDFFVKASAMSKALNPIVFRLWTGATHEETKLMSETKHNFRRVAAKEPLTLGLDTSLAQVSLSLNKRNKYDYATPDRLFEIFPRRAEILDNQPADSKPAVWWNLKYKNRWLSDGSVLSGNPILTNILWNEIGRGADLHELETWLDNNQKVLDEITAAVFATEAPRITDFIPAERIDIRLARQGEQLFNQNCAKCHGQYEKAWSLPNAENLPLVEQLKTTRVLYKERTRVHDVGTDPYRRLGMKSLEKLNDLAISKRHGIEIKTQPGYVPPPLVGIWARWPYFHNNAIPNLCALLTPSKQRPATYYSGEANDIKKDFDLDCNGYPLGEKTPKEWRTAQHLYDSRRKGLGNFGHDEDIFVKEGKEILSSSDKKALIRFLQTL